MESPILNTVEKGGKEVQPNTTVVTLSMNRDQDRVRDRVSEPLHVSVDAVARLRPFGLKVLPVGPVGGGYESVGGVGPTEGQREVCT